MEADIHEHIKEGLTKRGRPKCEPSRKIDRLGGIIIGVSVVVVWFFLKRFKVFPDLWVWVDYVFWIGSLLLAEYASWRLHGRALDALIEQVETNEHAVCIKCGYILKGLGETGTCPECAMPFDIAKVQRYWRRGYFKMPDLPDPEDIRILREQMERKRR